MNKEVILERLEANELPCNDALAEKLRIYLNLLTEWNRKMDLTAVMGEEELLARHFLDSLTVMKTGLFDGAETLIDVGTGAGFPGLVIAMACPELQVTLLDSQQKRLNFLQAVIEATDTSNAVLLHARAEDGARNPDLREHFDVACARAVAPLNVLCEYLLPYVRVGGRMLCWKGPGLADEMEAGKKAAFLLGGKFGEPLAAPLNGYDWNHLLLPVEKTGKTPKMYPRKAGQPKAKPLGT